MKKQFNKLESGESLAEMQISRRNKEFIDNFMKHLAGYDSEERRKKFHYSLTRFADLIEKDFDKITKEEMRSAGGIINSDKLSNLSIRTKQDIIKEVKTAFKHWFGDDEYFPPVLAGFKAPKSKGQLKLPEDMPDEKQIYNMIKACGNSRDKFFIALLGLDGAIRPIEARRMKFSQIKKDKYGYFITINTAKKSGDKDTRTVRIIKSEPYYIKWNQEYPAEKKDDAFVFVNYSNLKPMNQGTIAALFRRLKKKLGLKVLYPYILRHSLLTRMSKDPRIAMSVLKKFAGHSLRSNTIAEYQHFGDDDLKDMQLQINGIIKNKEIKEDERKPIECPKCKKSNEYDAEYCGFCNMALSQKRMLEISEILEENNKLMQKKFKHQFDEWKKNN